MKRAGLLREHKRLEENDAFSDRVSVVLETRRTRRCRSFGVGFFVEGVKSVPKMLFG